MNPISLASGAVPECGPIETIAAARSGGFDAAGLWVEPDRWTPALLRDCRRALNGAGMPLLDVEVVWIKPDDDIAAHKRLIDIGAGLGAANVLCVCSDADHGRAAAVLAGLCRHAEGTGLRLALEYGVFTEVKSAAAALTIVEAVAHPLAAILVDPIHVDRSGGGAADIAAIPRALLPYAQFCDAPAQRPDPQDFGAVIEDAIDLRAQLGEGALPLAEMLRALPPGIPLSIELRSRALREAYPDARARARAVADATRRWLKANAC